MLIRLILCLLFLPACSAHALVCMKGYTLKKNRPTAEKICDDVSFMIENKYKQCNFDQLTLLDAPIIYGGILFGNMYQCSFCYKCK